VPNGTPFFMGLQRTVCVGIIRQCLSEEVPEDCVAFKSDPNLKKKSRADELAKENRLEEAKRLYLAVCQSNRHDVEAWVKLGTINRRLGLYQEAERCSRHGVFLAPDLGFTHYALGAALQCQGKLQEAISCQRTALGLMPRFADAYYLLGNALHESGELAEAADCYRQAVQIQPNCFEALSDLGALLVTTGNCAEAMVILHQGLGLKPDSIAVRRNLSNAQHLQGRTEEALDSVMQMLSANPGSAVAIAGAAIFMERIGRISDAAELVKSGLLVAPQNPELQLVAARLARREGHYQDVADILESIRNQQMSKETAGEVLIMLGQAYDQLGFSSKVFPLLVEGNRLIAQTVNSIEPGRVRYLQRIDLMSRYATPLLATGSGELNSTDIQSPAFLLGFPRSGTTLLDQILDSHPLLQTMEEKGAVSLMLNSFLSMGNESDNALADLRQADIQLLREVYFTEVNRHLQLLPDTMLIDKLPLNTIALPLIWKVFPTAKIIMAVRHPCDVCLSCFMQNFAVNEAMANFLTLHDTVQLYAKVMGAWQKYKQVLPFEYKIVRYEDLLSDMKKESSVLLDFLGVGWHEAVQGHAEHALSRQAINTPSYHQVAQPIYQHAKYRWKRYRDEFEPYMETLQPFIDCFGYN